MWTGNRQASRLRMMYLKAALRQDIGFFDTKADAGRAPGVHAPA